MSHNFIPGTRLGNFRFRLLMPGPRPVHKRIRKQLSRLGLSKDMTKRLYLQATMVRPNEAVFEVPMNFSKPQIRAYLKNLYDLECENVDTAIVPRKNQKDVKHAYVTLTRPFQWSTAEIVRRNGFKLRQSYEYAHQPLSDHALDMLKQVNAQIRSTLHHGDPSQAKPEDAKFFGTKRTRPLSVNVSCVSPFKLTRVGGGSKAHISKQRVEAIENKKNRRREHTLRRVSQLAKLANMSMEEYMEWERERQIDSQNVWGPRTRRQDHDRLLKEVDFLSRSRGMQQEVDRGVAKQEHHAHVLLMEEGAVPDDMVKQVTERDMTSLGRKAKLQMKRELEQARLNKEKELQDALDKVVRATSTL
ncbi:MAG: hypothetical protein MHM6MM_000812 [Cercozoa sp. M6MM]